MRRTLRRIPMLFALVALIALGATSLAVAHGDRGGEHGKRGAEHGKRSHGDNGRHLGWWKHYRHLGRTCGQDRTWLRGAIEGDRFEIAGGALAQQSGKGTNPAVIALAQRLVTDHTASLKNATDLAGKLRVEVPGDPSPTQQWELDVLGTFSGAAFDQWYSKLEVADHKQDIEEAQDEVRYGCNKIVRREAAMEIPVLQEHLKLAEAALAATQS
jgi:putative membrane protein